MQLGRLRRERASGCLDLARHLTTHLPRVPRGTGGHLPCSTVPLTRPPAREPRAAHLHPCSTRRPEVSILAATGSGDMSSSPRHLTGSAPAALHEDRTRRGPTARWHPSTHGPDEHADRAPHPRSTWNVRLDDSTARRHRRSTRTHVDLTSRRTARPFRVPRGTPDSALFPPPTEGHAAPAPFSSACVPRGTWGQATSCRRSAPATSPPRARGARCLPSRGPSRHMPTLSARGAFSAPRVPRGTMMPSPPGPASAHADLERTEPSCPASSVRLAASPARGHAASLRVRAYGPVHVPRGTRRPPTSPRGGTTGLVDLTCARLSPASAFHVEHAAAGLQRMRGATLDLATA
jgi:hypothetical protein